MFFCHYIILWTISKGDVIDLKTSLSLLGVIKYELDYLLEKLK